MKSFISNFNFSHKIIRTIIIIISIVGYGVVVLATQLPAGTPPSSNGYAAGDTIFDPGCHPEDQGCFKNITGGSGSAAGLDGQIQYNDNGSFGADANFLWDKNSKIFRVGDVIGSSNNTVFTVDDSNNLFSFSTPNITIAGIPYVFPTSQGNSGDSLVNDGSGNLLWAHTSSGSGWGLTGNTGTDVTKDFLGTLDHQDLAFRTNNNEVARLFTTGDFALFAYPSSRNDIPATAAYSVGTTQNPVNTGSPNDITFGGTYTGSSADQYAIIINGHNSGADYYLNGIFQYTIPFWNAGDIVTLDNGVTITFGSVGNTDPDGDEWLMTIAVTGVVYSEGSTTNPVNTGSPNDITFGGTYTGSSADRYKIIIDGRGNPEYYLNDASISNFTSNTLPATETLDNGVTVTFGSNKYNPGEEWDMTVGPQVSSGSQPQNFLYTDSRGKLQSAPLSSIGGGSGWGLTGNTGTDSTINFIGTTDSHDLIFKTNNSQAFKLSTTGNAQLNAYPNTRNDGLFTTYSVGSTTNPVNYGSNNDVVFGGTYTGSGVDHYRLLMNDKGDAIYYYNGRVQRTIRSSTYGSPQTLDFGVTVTFGSTYKKDEEWDMTIVGSSSGTAATNFLYTNSTGNVLSEPLSSIVKLAWGLGGNAGTDGGTTNFIGTTDRQDLVFKTNNTEALRIVSSGSVNILGNLSEINAVNYSWPSSQASTGGQVLTNDGSGNLSWTTPSGGTSGWALTGNAGTTSGTNFIGTTDAQDLVFKVSNTEQARFYVNGNIAMGGAVLSSYNSFNTFAFGYGAGAGVNSPQNSAFMGYQAAYGATSASYSNIIGYQAGYQAINVSDVNFLGQYAGYGASNVTTSNFIGYDAGANASNASHSNFIGELTGNLATNATNSTFLGYYSGLRAANANHSFFAGSYAGSYNPSLGLGTANAANSIFIGNNAAYKSGDTSLNNISPAGTSILIGDDSSTGGFSNSIAIGKDATNTATNQFLVASAYNNWNIAGINYVWPSSQASTAGQVLTNNGSGTLSWVSPTGSSGWSLTGNTGTTPGTNFIGTRDNNDFVIKANNTEYGRIYANGSIAFGGSQALSADMFTYGNLAGQGATNAAQSIFVGLYAGLSATNATGSVFIGASAGHGATDATGSTFVGPSAGNGATAASNSSFIGSAAGNNATNANGSVFIGPSAGDSSTFAYASNFIGNSTGAQATNANFSNFIGQAAGSGATNANNSTFIGYLAGQYATNANNSFFVGQNAGTYNSITSKGSINSAHSIFIGQNSGYFAADNSLNNITTPGTSILIGDNTSTGGFSNSIALGAGATNTKVNQFMIGSSTSAINEMDIIGSAGQSCTIRPDTVGISCSSDETLKTNITDLSNTTLNSLLNVRTVTFNWNNNPTGNQVIGFLAQDIQSQFPQVVSAAPDGHLQVNYSEMTPVLVESIRELNLKLVDIQKVADGIDRTFLQNLIAWLGGSTNHLTSVHVDQQLCIGSTCINEGELQAFKVWEASSHTVSVPTSGGTPPIVSATGTSVTTSDTSTTASGTGTIIVPPPVIDPMTPPVVLPSTIADPVVSPPPPSPAVDPTPVTSAAPSASAPIATSTN
jgi:hypothetical protein